MGEVYIESHPRQLIFLRKSDCLGCAVLLCLVCLFDLACFFLPSLIKTCTLGESYYYTCITVTLTHTHSAAASSRSSCPAAVSSASAATVSAAAAVVNANPPGRRRNMVRQVVEGKGGV